MNFPDIIRPYGWHEDGSELLPGSAVLRLYEIGDDPHNQAGADMSDLVARSYHTIARLQYRWGYQAGCIPSPDRYDHFARRVGNFVRSSVGIEWIIIGNEMNHPVEWPQGQPIMPEQYALCYKLCVKYAGQALCVGPTAPWNDQIGMDWKVYYESLLDKIPPEYHQALMHHSYTHGTDPGLIYSSATMEYPYQDRYYHWKHLYQFMFWTPKRFRHLPVIVTEANQTEAWRNINSGWVRNMYRSVMDWNAAAHRQKIYHVLLYRYPKHDEWYIQDKTGVVDDMYAAMADDHIVQKGETSEMPDNMIRNPLYEEPYRSQNGLGTVQMAAEHQAFWHQGRDYEAMPEYSLARTSVGGPEWGGAQQWSVESKLMDAGIMQRFEVGDDAVGKWARLEVVLGVEAHDNSKEKLSNAWLTIGIDRTGNDQDRGKAVEWLTPIFQVEISNHHEKFGPLKTWSTLVIEVPIETPWITYFVHCKDEYRFDTNVFVKQATCVVFETVCVDPDPPPVDPELPEGALTVDQYLATLVEIRDGYIKAARVLE